MLVFDAIPDGGRQTLSIIIISVHFLLLYKRYPTKIPTRKNTSFRLIRFLYIGFFCMIRNERYRQQNIFSIALLNDAFKSK